MTAWDYHRCIMRCFTIWLSFESGNTPPTHLTSREATRDAVGVRETRPHRKFTLDSAARVALHSPMRSPEENAAMIREQVISKVIWGTTDDEVLDWLHSKHGITDEAADKLLAEAHRIRLAAVKSKAKVHLGISIGGMVLALIYVLVRSGDRYVDIGIVSYIVFGVGLISLIMFIRSLLQLLKGESQGPVDG
jgi:hypothetical protein